MAAPTYAAPHAESEVSLLLSKFGEQVQSRQLRQLSKSQLEKKEPFSRLFKLFALEPGEVALGCFF